MAAGIDAKVFSGHSLRAGFITSALDAGVKPMKIIPITGQKKVDTLQGYDRRENDFDTHASGNFYDFFKAQIAAFQSLVLRL